MNDSTEYPHLPKAPITEAIIDFRAKLSGDFSPEVFKALRSELAGEYPKMEERKGVQFEVRFPPSTEQSQPMRRKDLGVEGYFFRSADGQNLAQFRRDGFTFNRLQPYTKWDDVFGRAAALWRRYAQIAKPVDVPRIAVRYINRLLLPQPLKSPSNFLTALPAVPERWPRHMGGFLNRLVLLEPEAHTAANVTLAIESGVHDQHVPVLFDIDVYKENAFDGDTERLLEHFTGLRQMKNRIFFGGLTEEGVNLFR